VRILSSTPVKIPVGGTARVRLGTPAAGFSGRFDVELNQAPDGITIKEVLPSSDGTDIVLESDAAKVKPGSKGNLIVNIFPGRNLVPAAKAKKQAGQRVALGTLPAIPFEIVPE
jgi:hypothetical protein